MLKKLCVWIEREGGGGGEQTPLPLWGEPPRAFLGGGGGTKSLNPLGRIRPRVYWAAAMLALFALCAAWFAASRNSVIAEEAKSGEPLLVTLPDQSVVLLSRGSLITYPKTFGQIREVQ